MIFKKHYPALDYLRVAAITMVMAIHYEQILFPFIKEGFALKLIGWGWHGVNLFFALSGFLVGGQILEEVDVGKFSFKVFYIKRFLRIFPPYYFVITVIIIFYLVGASKYIPLVPKPFYEDNSLLRDTIVNIFYLNNYLMTTFWINGEVFWSLAVEEHFYLLAPLVLYFLAKYGKRAILFGLILLILLPISMRFALYEQTGDWQSDYMRPSHMRFDALLLGVLAAYLFIHYQERLIYLSKITKALLLSIGLILLAITFVYGEHKTGYFNVCWQFTLTGLGFSIVVLLLTIITPPWKGVYVGKIFSYIAKISYEMYLWHFMVFLPFANFVFFKFFDYDKASLSQYAVTFILYYFVVVSFSGLVYWVVDRPSMNYRKRFLQIRKKEKMVT